MIDGGATRPLRQGFSEKLRDAVPARVGLASGSTTSHLSPVNTLLSKDAVSPIIPLRAVCSELGYRATWDGGSGCVLKHPKHGKLNVTMVAGCPELPEGEVCDLIRRLEQQRATKLLRAVTVLSMRGASGEELDLPWVLASCVGDLGKAEMALLRWVAGMLPASGGAVSRRYALLVWW